MKNNKQSNTSNINSINTVVSEENFFVSVLSCIHRTNVRFFMNLPTRARNFIKRKINEYKNKPKRTEINKVYVLIGYTTKQNIDNRFNNEHLMIVFRRLLLIIIFFLLLFISIQWIKPLIVVDQYKQIFGVETVEDITSNDPFNSTSELSSAAKSSSDNDK